MKSKASSRGNTSTQERTLKENLNAPPKTKEIEEEENPSTSKISKTKLKEKQ